MTTIIFSHGKESGPNGTKIQILREIAKKHNHQSISVDYTSCSTIDERYEKLKKVINFVPSSDIILVGSSMGGYLSTIASNERNVKAMFLFCPALYMSDREYGIHEYNPKCINIEIIHGWNDEIVPFENSVKFAKQCNAILNLVDDNHRLQHSHNIIKERFDFFLNRLEE
ncbi:MAG: S9 family peptidase [Marinifilaceae bacterium]|jgi:predicted esterase|nr:S9 family peptidase [Marinifilaceae bacterium]